MISVNDWEEIAVQQQQRLKVNVKEQDRAPREEIMTAQAGFHAELKFIGGVPDDDLRAGAASDEKHIMPLSKEFNLKQAEVEGFEDETTELINFHWGKIAALAEGLLQKPHLDTKNAQKIIENSVAKPST